MNSQPQTLVRDDATRRAETDGIDREQFVRGEAEIIHQSWLANGRRWKTVTPTGSSRAWRALQGWAAHQLAAIAHRFGQAAQRVSPRPIDTPARVLARRCQLSLFGARALLASLDTDMLAKDEPQSPTTSAGPDFLSASENS